MWGLQCFQSCSWQTCCAGACCDSVWMGIHVLKPPDIITAVPARILRCQLSCKVLCAVSWYDLPGRAACKRIQKGTLDTQGMLVHMLSAKSYVQGSHAQMASAVRSSTSGPIVTQLGLADSASVCCCPGLLSTARMTLRASSCTATCSTSLSSCST